MRFSFTFYFGPSGKQMQHNIKYRNYRSAHLVYLSRQCHASWSKSWAISHLLETHICVAETVRSLFVPWSLASKIRVCVKTTAGLNTGDARSSTFCVRYQRKSLQHWCYKHYAAPQTFRFLAIFRFNMLRDIVFPAALASPFPRSCLSSLNAFVR